ncbi:hypothetical protein R8Z57_13890 [Microbacterium sp. M3]|uniref:O-antigen ligase domain-containing protein n=1 Tax=Microbacterium arthrosphaerae TaxID=792652 RepID=A0ABU4H3H3_9MICO|nr:MULTISPECIES: hypothetical protein [Microbacterium]MDW4573868.1 hypothetical protein [Microbacterium arthrosphaerae]MDW7607723.1 hypothetical protein [Microbacterium sp. M3]
MTTAWLLAGPRIELLSIASSSIRLEDLLLFALLVLAAVHGWKRVKAVVGLRMLVATGAVVTVGILSAVIAVAAGRIDALAGLLYVARPIEYWVVLPAVLLCLKRSEGRSRRVVVTLAVVTCLQVTVGALQVLGVPIGFSKFTYERAAGLTAGPYELGAMCAMLVCFWLYRRSYALAAIALVGIILSQSRISLAAVALGIAIILLSAWGTISRSLARLWRRRAVFVSTLAGIFVLTVLLAAWLGRPVIERLTDTSLVNAWVDAQRFSHAAPILTTSDAYSHVAFDRIDTVLTGASIEDVSNVVRFFRWQLLLAAMAATPLAWVFGLGPSFAGPSVDGTILRILVEFGLVGLIAWIAWFYQSVRGAGVWLVAVLATLVVGSTTIDLMFALRPMVLFWFLAAFARIERPLRDAALSPRSTSDQG